MSDDNRGHTGSETSHVLAPAQTPAQNLRVELNANNLVCNYSNFFRVTGTFEELIIDFGLHTGAILPTGPEAVKLSQRTVLSFATAKRLLAALQVAINRHEQVFGTLEIDPQKRMKGSG